MVEMCRPMTEPVKGEPEHFSDSSGGWAFAPSGTRWPFDKIIRITLMEHGEGNNLVARWGKKGTYTLRYNEDLAEEIRGWKVGKRYRVKMWMDRIDVVDPK